MSFCLPDTRPVEQQQPHFRLRLLHSAPIVQHFEQPFNKQTDKHVSELC